jgi:hypothetical protein
MTADPENSRISDAMLGGVGWDPSL